MTQPETGPGSPEAEAHGPGYWLASDGNWYPPEQRPGPTPIPPTNPPPAQYGAYGTYPQPNAWNQAGNPYPTAPVVQPNQTNPFAIWSLVCACAGVIPFLGIVGVILGVIFGFVAKSQINRTGGVQQGAGLATAGIVVSFAITAVWIILFIAFGTFSTTTTCTNGFCSN